MSDLVGPEGCVYAVEFSHRSGRDLVNMAKKRTNVIPIIEDARHPAKYRMLVGMVDVIFSDVAQPDQVCFFFVYLAMNSLNILQIWLGTFTVLLYYDLCFGFIKKSGVLMMASDDFTWIPLQIILGDVNSKLLMLKNYLFSCSFVWFCLGFFGFSNQI